MKIISSKRSIFLFYIILSFIYCLTIYLFTIYNNVFSISNDFYGLFRGFPADAEYYLNQAVFEIEEYNRNVGPILILKFFNSNYLIIFIAQFIIYQLLVMKLYFLNNIKSKTIYLSIPLLSISTIFVNKEIYTIYSMLSLVIFCITKRNIWVLIAFLTGFFSRPEFILLLVLFCFIYKFKKYYKIIFIIIFILVTLFYSDFNRMDEYRSVLERGQKGTLSISLITDNFIRNYYSYIIMFPLKIILAIYDGGIFNIITFSFLLVIYFLKRRFVCINIILLLMLIYGTFASFPHFRYIYPVYALLLFGSDLKIKNVKSYK
jgi:hypothetical protein